MQFHALLEEWPGESIAFFRELPGCFSSAPTTDAALQAAPAVIEAYFSWLKENNIVLVEEEITPIEVVLSERLSSNGHAGPLFQADLAAPDDLEIDNALNVAATARAQIIEMVANVPEQFYNLAPAPASWSLLQHLQHIMESENFYVSRLESQPAPEQPTPAMTADEISMKIFENAMDSELLLRDLSPEQRTQVFTHNGEAWTAAKVLRRMAQHLREHHPWMLAMAEQFAASSRTPRN
ncbi:MAG TPA: DinB family protein [Ktedonobacteraceae bacterium]|nr:DinB family protein [Ktedonobacteraceae bacterium]